MDKYNELSSYVVKVCTFEGLKWREIVFYLCEGNLANNTILGAAVNNPSDRLVVFLCNHNCVFMHTNNYADIYMDTKI